MTRSHSSRGREVLSSPGGREGGVVHPGGEGGVVTRSHSPGGDFRCCDQVTQTCPGGREVLSILGGREGGVVTRSHVWGEGGVNVTRSHVRGGGRCCIDQVPCPGAEGQGA